MISFDKKNQIVKNINYDLRVVIFGKSWPVMAHNIFSLYNKKISMNYETMKNISIQTTKYLSS
jgi:hypothetical protein